MESPTQVAPLALQLLPRCITCSAFERAQHFDSMLYPARKDLEDPLLEKQSETGNGGAWQCIKQVLARGGSGTHCGDRKVAEDSNLLEAIGITLARLIIQ